MTDSPHVQYFGPAWRRKEWEVQIPTPVGQLCGYCTEAIEPDHVGTMQMHVDLVDGEPVATWRPVHYECSLRSAVGSVAHIEGVCSCNIPGSHEGDPEGMSLRDAALLAVAAWEARQ